MNKTKLHPAKELFLELFNKAATGDNPCLPEYFVPRSWFHQKCRDAGIPAPENFIEAIKWEESIGLQKFAKRVFSSYRKKQTACV